MTTEVYSTNEYKVHKIFKAKFIKLTENSKKEPLGNIPKIVDKNRIS